MTAFNVLNTFSQNRKASAPASSSEVKGCVIEGEFAAHGEGAPWARFFFK